MGLFGFGHRDVHKALAQTAPGVSWQVECFGGDPSTKIWFAALHRKDRLQFPELSFEMAELLSADIWRNLMKLRSQVSHLSIWIEADDGRWAGTGGDGAALSSDELPNCFT